MMAGISVGLYLCFWVSGAAQGSYRVSNAGSLAILLLYLGLGRGCPLFLNLLGSKGGRRLRLSS